MNVPIIANLEPAVVTTLVIVGFVATAALVIWLAARNEKKRTERLAEVADELGMNFSAEQDTTLLGKVQSFPVFNQGRSRAMKNVMTAETENTRLAIFEYQFTTGGGKNSQTHRFTIAAMESGELNLPHFTVRPEGFFDRIGSKLGFQDIDFDDHPEFSEAFVLQGNDESAIRSYFTRRILDLFSANKGVLVDASGNLLTYRKRGRQKPEAISDFMAEAYDFLNAFNESEETDNA